MELAELARWTPIRFDLSGPVPTVDWADLSEERFVEPFFDQTVARWASGPRARPLVRTGLEALVILDNEPSLEPAGMIFHLSRCGSTLVSRMLGTLPGTVVISEPSPLNALLGLDPGRVSEAMLVRSVRLLVRALGRCRHGDEHHLVLKCTSWNIRRREILAAAFPETPWAWVQRDPAHVLASLLAKPPGWLGLQAVPPRTARLFGLDPQAVPARARVEFAAVAVQLPRHFVETAHQAGQFVDGRHFHPMAQIPLAHLAGRMHQRGDGNANLPSQKQRDPGCHEEDEQSDQRQ